MFTILWLAASGSIAGIGPVMFGDTVLLSVFASWLVDRQRPKS
jgi:hypothetical protein